MCIATCNISGARTAARKGMGGWIASAKVDVPLLQGVRALEEPVASLVEEGYKTIPWSCEIKGHIDVAVAVHERIETGTVVHGVSDDQLPVDTGKWLEVELPKSGLCVVFAYLHSGDSSSKEKMGAKYTHLDLVEKRLAGLSESGGRLLTAGGFSTAHMFLDIMNWKSNHNRASDVLDEEIAYLDRWFDQMGLTDVQRRLDPDSQGPYTQWSQRGKAFDDNTGQRIDYHLTNPSLTGKADIYRINRAPPYGARFSDHAPLIVDCTP